MSSPDPIVGMATPVLNAARWLDEMLWSVRAQTYSAWRLVVVDDGSDDASREIASRHAGDDDRITVMSSARPRSGAPAVRAHGRRQLGEATYLYFPDADDVLEPELVASLVARLQAQPDAVAAFCRYVRIDQEGAILPEPPVPRIALTKRWSRALRDDEQETPFESIYAWAAPAMEPVTMLRADAYDRAGGWEAWPVQGGESIDLLCRMLADGPVLFEPSSLYRYRAHPQQHTRNRGHYAAAAIALRESWRARTTRSAELRPHVEMAEFFVDHRLVPRIGLQTALLDLRRARIGRSARFALGAIRRYRWSPPSNYGL